MRKPLINLTMILVLVITGAAVAQDNDPVDFELQLLDGSSLAMADLRGQWVVVNYWATWCAPCRKEIPDLSELHERAANISVVGVAYEDTEPAEFVAFLEELQPSYPNGLVDVYNPPAAFGTPRALPTTHLLNPDGIPVKTFVGPVTGVQIEAFVAEAEKQ